MRQHSILLGALLSTFIFVQFSSIAIANEPISASPSELIERIDAKKLLEQDTFDKACGVYALTFMLNMDGVSCEPEEVIDLVEISDEGSSLKDLQTAAQAFGRSYQPYKVAPSKLDSLKLPAIAHLEATDLQPVAHYVVLLKVYPDSVEIFDWNGRSVTRHERDAFTRRSSGYFLVSKPSSNLRTLSLIVLVGGVCIGGISVIKGLRPNTLPKAD